MTCSVEGCEKPVKSKGWCAAHYMRWYRKGDPGPGGLRVYGVEGCDVAGCDREHVARGKCARHLNRLVRLGTVELPPPPKCSIPGCKAKHYAKRKCQRHYDMARNLKRSTVRFPKQPPVLAAPLVEHLNALRRRGWSDGRIAERISVDIRTVQRWMRRPGDERIKRASAERICDELGLHPAMLWSDWVICKHGRTECRTCRIGVAA